MYENPTVAALATFVFRFASGAAVDAAAERAARIAQMRALLDKHGAGFAAPRWRTGGAGASAVGETVLVTGSTGRLGSHLLAQMLARQDVKRVYALNRGADGKARQKAALQTWGLDAGLVDDPRVVFCAADVAKKDLGVGSEVYEEVRIMLSRVEFRDIDGCTDAVVCDYDTQQR